jgi:hypothetical protein
MEQQIDGIRAWIAMEKARARIKRTHPMMDYEILMMFAIRLGFNTVSELAAFRGWAKDGKEYTKKIGGDMAHLLRFEYVIRTNRRKALKGQNLYTYQLTDKGKKALAMLDKAFDDIYCSEIAIDLTKDVMQVV